MVSFEDIKHNNSINTYIRLADESLSAQGFTEHSFPHMNFVSRRVEYILRKTGASQREIELGKIAAYLHDIGNLVNREEHSQSGAVMAFRILLSLGMEAEDVGAIVTAIGNHDEGNGVPVSNIAAALIIADKSDVRRSRIRNTDISTFDIHDRVNYSVNETHLHIDEADKTITLTMAIETNFSSVVDYFEIFLQRMVLCRKAAAKLGLTFKLLINGQYLM